MDHRAAQDLFSEYLEGELAPEEQAKVAEHLQGCEECRKELETFRHTLRSLSGLRPLPPPDNFARKVQQRIHRRSRGRFFGGERIIQRVPFEWISFVIIIIMLVLYMLMMEQQKKLAPAPGSGSGGKAKVGEKKR
jgi:predicted anti-sigma-YlaC factor YlaD